VNFFFLSALLSYTDFIALVFDILVCFFLTLISCEWWDKVLNVRPF